MPASIEHQELVLQRQTVGILRDVEAGKIDLDQIGDWMRDQLSDLVMRSPMLITIHRDRVVLTDAGREYLDAVDPKSSAA